MPPNCLYGRLLYKDSLVSGKSSGLGRSHGIFLNIRGKLINLDDPLLGMEAFSHGAFNRTRIIINADELDKNLTSTREAVKESLPFNQLKNYIKRKFNSEIRTYYFDEENREADKRTISYRLAQTSYTTSGIEETQINEVMRKRDTTLRELALPDREGILINLKVKLLRIRHTTKLLIYRLKLYL